MNDYLDYLQHHGIKGQKWGVRRFQNPDGSLTARGRKRQSSEKEGRDFGRSNPIQRRRMSDEELVRRIGRLSQEKKLMDLERDISPGRKAVEEVITNAGKQTATKIFAGVSLAGVAVLIGKAMGANVSAGSIFKDAMKSKK